MYIEKKISQSICTGRLVKQNDIKALIKFILLSFIKKLRLKLFCYLNFQDTKDANDVKDNKNAPPILVLAKEGYVINPATGNEQELQQPVAPRYGRGRRMRNGFYKRGISGYDPEYPDMRGVFMARGPGNYSKYTKLCRNIPILLIT